LRVSTSVKQGFKVLKFSTHSIHSICTLQRCVLKFRNKMYITHILTRNDLFCSIILFTTITNPLVVGLWYSWGIRQTPAQLISLNSLYTIIRFNSTFFSYFLPTTHIFWGCQSQNKQLHTFWGCQSQKQHFPIPYRSKGSSLPL